MARQSVIIVAIVAGAGNEDFIAMGAYECVGVFITEIINGVLGIIAQFYQVYGIGVVLCCVW
jgi:hypothetical protein